VRIISIMAAESMSLRDMLFWFFITLFGTGTYVIYGFQSVTGEVLGISMVVVGLIGMIGCAWPYLKDPITGKFGPTWERLRKVRNIKIIGSVLVLAIALLVSVGVRVYRHFHLDAETATVKPAETKPSTAPTQQPAPASPPVSHPVIDMTNNTDSEANGNIVSIPDGTINAANSQRMRVNSNVFDKDFVAHLSDKSYVENLLATQRRWYEDHWEVLPQTEKAERLRTLSALEAQIRAVEGDGNAVLPLVDRLFHLSQ
jgi:hypothetical protein